jgi:hypothetical protein
MFKYHPNVFSIPLADALLDQGALLPMYFVESLYDQSEEQGKDFPEGAVEYMVAQGYKTHGNDLDLGQSSQQRSTLDDAYRFKLALEASDLVSSQVTKELDALYNKHFFVPALLNNVPCSLWDGMYTLLKKNRSMATKFIADAQLDIQISINHIVALALIDGSETTLHSLRKLNDMGFTIDALSLSFAFSEYSPEIMADSDRIMTHLESILGTDTFKSTAKAILRHLLTHMTLKSMHSVNLLLDHFDFPEDVFRDALFVDSLQMADTESDKTKVYMTNFGRTHLGINKALWQFVMSRYGIHHPLTRACFSDLIIGGCVDDPRIESSCIDEDIDTEEQATAASPIATGMYFFYLFNEIDLYSKRNSLIKV